MFHLQPPHGICACSHRKVRIEAPSGSRRRRASAGSQMPDHAQPQRRLAVGVHITRRSTLTGVCPKWTSSGIAQHDWQNLESTLIMQETARESGNESDDELEADALTAASGRDLQGIALSILDPPTRCRTLPGSRAMSRTMRGRRAPWRRRAERRGGNLRRLRQSAAAGSNRHPRRSCLSSSASCCWPRHALGFKRTSLPTSTSSFVIHDAHDRPHRPRAVGPTRASGHDCRRCLFAPRLGCPGLRADVSALEPAGCKVE